MFFTYLQLNIEKRQAKIKEGVHLSSYIQNKSILVHKTPFPHIVVDNFLTEEAYKEISSYFTTCLERGLSQERDLDRFHPFMEHKGAFAYDGYVHPLRLGEHITTDVRFSVEWNLFFSNIFKQQTDWCTSTAFHYHPPNDKTGYVHSDYALKNFSAKNRLPNGVIPNDIAAPEKRKKKTLSSMRTISLIYYLNNDSWKPGDGGETGLYVDLKGAPLTLVEPINNRLFAFQVSPRSFHAFQQNFKPRSSIVQWFHIDSAWCQRRYGFVQ